MSVNQKKKGNKGERMVAKFFQDWTGYEFQRVPQSGGLRWGNAQNIAGDIICADQKHNRFFTFCVESKFYADLDWDKVFRNKVSHIMKFWEQAVSDAQRADKHPILFMRKNGMDAGMFYVIISYKVYRQIRKQIKDWEFPVVEINITDQGCIVVLNSIDLIKADYRALHKQLKRVTK